MNVLDLFSGIGGFSLGLERAGMRTVAFCEIEPFARRVLAQHWPNVPIYDDVRSLTADRLRADGIAADVICGGFPCQDISVAGKGAGLDGDRSGLWSEYARLIRELRPRYVIVENVAALLSRGLGRVLGDLAALGYDAEWHCIPASAVGAPHRRDRLWLVAYPNCVERWSQQVAWPECQGATVPEYDGAAKPVADAAGRGHGRRRHRSKAEPVHSGPSMANTRREPAQIPSAGLLAAIEVPQRHPWWSTEPDVGRVAHGVPARMDRLRGLGNAVVPLIPELIGRAIMSHVQ